MFRMKKMEKKLKIEKQRNMYLETKYIEKI